MADEKVVVAFEHLEEFRGLEAKFVSLDLTVDVEADMEDDRSERVLLRSLTLILDRYQEQAHLLDPHLEELVAPVLDAIKSHAKDFVSSEVPFVSRRRLDRLAQLLYSFVKSRGYKTITRFFPHEIADLSVVLDYMYAPNSPVNDSGQWALRYVILLWLSLICMIPFDLEQFDDPSRTGETAAKIDEAGKMFLNRAGKDRDGAAILLSRLYMRKDTSALFIAFFGWSAGYMTASLDPFPALGVLRVFCEVTKLGPADQVRSHAAELLQVARDLEGNASLMGNTLVRALRMKLVSRVVLRLLPAKSRKRTKAIALATDSSGNTTQLAEPDDDFDVPEEVESVLEELFKGLRDKDTVVRYSSAKAVARISERLPTDFAEQVLDTVLGLFSIHSVGVASIYDMPSVAEATWHGTCLACAEMARRGLIPDGKLNELVGWLSKASLFDIRKGAHSIGSNVRDSASYVLWSLARAQSVAALEPLAVTIAQRLVTVALFDREIHIRRAASAAFQEYVGRTSLFPHGIDVLGKTDFYAVGIRRNSFLVAAPEVAEHIVYRTVLIDHLLSVIIRHWDPTMRQLGAQSLSAIAQLDLVNLGPNIAARAAELLTMPDAGDVHGALAVLTELARVYRDAPNAAELQVERRKTFGYLAKVPLATIRSARQDLIATAACLLVANGISQDETQHDTSTVPHWRQVVDAGLRSKSESVQEAAAAALAAVSKLVDCSAVLDRLIPEFSEGTPSLQESLCRLLGVLDYAAHPHGHVLAARTLVRMIDRSSTGFTASVEARRNAFTSMAQLLENVSDDLPNKLQPDLVREILNALLDGLTDYTSDERGDVGSWVRIACLKSLTSFIETLFSRAPALPSLSEYFPSGKYHDAIAGILKQGVERLDNVRHEAGDCFLRLLHRPSPNIPNPSPWKIHGETKMRALFSSGTEATGWNEGAWLFPRAVQILDIERYRAPVLAGIVLSASSKTDSTQRPVTSSLVNFTLKLPVSTTEPDQYDQLTLVQDLLGQASKSVGSNNVVIPILQTLNLLLEADAFENLPSNAAGLQTLQSLLALVSKNISRLKSPQRVGVSMRCLVNLLPFSDMQSKCVARLPDFLEHQFPRIRADTAEYLYTVLTSKDIGLETDAVEEILLETEWSTSDAATVRGATKRVVELLGNANES